MWELVSEAETIITAKGKKVQTWNPKTDEKEAILNQAMGPSGNLRAPTFQVKDKFIIGFNRDLYHEWMK